MDRQVRELIGAVSRGGQGVLEKADALVEGLDGLLRAEDADLIPRYLTE
jgi:hypothetical protein